MYNRGGGSSDRPRGFGFTGFALPSSKAGPEAQLAKMGFGMVGGIGMHSRGYGTGLGKRRIKSEEEYFDDDEEDKTDDLEYQPAPDSPTRDKTKQDKHEPEDDVDSDVSDDPLDAFMAEIQDEVVKQEVKSTKKNQKKKKGVRDDIDNEDVEESYYRYMEENPMAGVILDDDNQPLEYDEDGNVIIPDKNRIIDPLPPVDHWEIEYQKFNKNFYEEHEDIAKLTESEVQELRQKLGIRVSGIQANYKPVSSFGHFGFDDELIKAILKMEFTQPTPIQAQGIPVILSGRDMIGVAKTGSGKTAAFLWPLLVHIMAQDELKKGDGPIGLICAPTRELSQQIYHEAKRFGKIYNIKVVCAYGGGNMWEQCKACEEGAEIIVCTPGRLIDLVKKKATNLRRVTYVVFDEADRMFDMGFDAGCIEFNPQLTPGVLSCSAAV
ncbi:hypothetical protein NP493_790g01048 [Ridgeia piscesae]|uniref:RNA helicase n=1 Tax=Ridgeia piscesae TaxID=27915 RepID=A0AAD9KNK3_RIDPI|nr:hypothetical protein NP493_790g01048 [Ridgeia piscesae]